ncbi:uncharacterized protein LOC111256257 [Setaria italica]|uniref:uncharacterized protein LOC111256257 n=1 Tax=Setaria italica TaxID=4555 RepID=UPI000BE56BCD|nr:uncharacterized protein LOC111256257 [Setaria italica]
MTAWPGPTKHPKSQTLVGLPEHERTMAKPRARAPAPPELMEDAVEEILLRLPPDEPAALVRASLVCKPWRRIVSDPAFLRRYRRFHPTPPLLGFFNELYGAAPERRFVPTTPASPFPKAAFDRRSWAAVDCRHGRVLLQKEKAGGNFVVWDPITGDQEELHMPSITGDRATSFYSASVLCAAAGCDHRDCHGGPFLVVYLGNDESQPIVHACVYSSESGAWVTMVSAHIGYNDFFTAYCGTLISDEIYQVIIGDDDAILKYDLGNHCLSVIGLPDESDDGGIVPMPTEDGSLGLASISASCLHLWSRKVNEDGIAGWVQCRVVDLQALLPIDSPCKRAYVIGFAEGVGVIFVTTEVGTFTVELKSGKVKKIVLAPNCRC